MLIPYDLFFVHRCYGSAHWYLVDTRFSFLHPLYPVYSLYNCRTSHAHVGIIMEAIIMKVGEDPSLPFGGMRHLEIH